MSSHIPSTPARESRQDIQRRPRRHARIAAAAAAALVISWGGPAANAFWQTLSSNPGTARADSIPEVAAPAASGTAGAASVSWTAGTTAAGRPVSGYTVARYSSASGGTKVAAGGGCAGTVAALGCTEANVPAGTWFYTVTAVLAAWQGPESARSSGVAASDTTAPAAPAVTAPALINSENVANVQVGGTAEAGSSVTVTVADAGAVHTASQTIAADEADGEWAAADFNLAAFADGTITYSAVATDAAGNASAPGTASSTKDSTAPAVVGVSLSNGSGNQFKPDAGDKLTLKFSELLKPSTICSSWANDTPGVQTVNGSEQVTVTIIGGNTLTLNVDGAGCATARFGSVAFSSAYSAGGTLTFGGTGLNGSKVSSLTWNPTGSELIVTLGSLTGGTPTAKSGNVTATYTPVAGLTDAAGNALPVGPVAGSPSRF